MGQTATTIEEYEEYPYDEDEEEYTDEEEEVENNDSNENGETKDQNDENQKPQDQKRIQNINLVSLSTQELQSHLSKYTFMTKHDIRNIAYQQSTDEFVETHEEWYQQQSNNTSTSTCASTPSPTNANTTTNDNNNNDKNQQIIVQKSHMDVALDILNLSPEIKSLRFKLVPAKLSESNFWSAVFYILEYYKEEELGASETLVAALMMKKKNKMSDETKVLEEEDITLKVVPTSKVVVTSSNNDKLKRLMKQKDDEVQSLKKQLQQAKNDVSRLQTQLSKLSSSSSNGHHPNQQQQHKHQGKWIMSQESKEFLMLDNDIKVQLRQGKKKRIQDVYEQMKFIMDTDDVKDSQGKWECCGNTVFQSSCPTT